MKALVETFKYRTMGTSVLSSKESILGLICFCPWIYMVRVLTCRNDWRRAFQRHGDSVALFHCETTCSKWFPFSCIHIKMLDKALTQPILLVLVTRLHNVSLQQYFGLGIRPNPFLWCAFMMVNCVVKLLIIITNGENVDINVGGEKTHTQTQHYVCRDPQDLL